MDPKEYVLVRDPGGSRSPVVCSCTYLNLVHVDPVDQLIMSIARVVVPDMPDTRPYGSVIWVGRGMASPLQEL